MLNQETITESVMCLNNHHIITSDDVPANSGLNFTYRALEHFYDVVDHPDFESDDYRMIYEILRRQLKKVCFGDYLKRFLYQQAGMTGSYADIPQKEYVDLICRTFDERYSPCAFKPTTATLRNLAKNWLEQQTVSRDTVLILGFGLGMSIDEVNDFFTKALQETRINPKDPHEVICWYCFSFGFGFAKYKQLMDLYVKRSAGILSPNLLNSTVKMYNNLRKVTDEEQLLSYLYQLPMHEGSIRQSYDGRKQFDKLYMQTCEHVARIMTEAEQDSSHIMYERAADAPLRDNGVRKVTDGGNVKKKYTAEDVSQRDIEQILYAAIPSDGKGNGNLKSMKESGLYSRFGTKRLTRQHINQILTGKEPVTRYDLLTLHFFVFSQRDDLPCIITKRMQMYLESAGFMLAESGMGEYYIANPYECFLLMCVVSQDPLGTFSDVWEASYQRAE